MDPPSLETLSSIGPGGARNFLHPAKARGRFTRARTIVFAVLIALLVVLPFITINGRPGVWLDMAGRSFHFLGFSVGPTQTWLLFLIALALAFALVVTSALWGRIWCGWACPQTVWLEGVYRRVERLFEGDRHRQIQLDDAPWGPEKVLRKGGKNLVFLLLSVAIAHLLVCYFVPPAKLWQLMGSGPGSDPEVFIWTSALTAVVFFDYAWFREQMCIIVCPYGRLQSVLTDQDTVVVGYDARRGEPRGKASKAGIGDCVDCSRCVAVCPTGIDIRQGLQLECVGCAACVDACDEIMAKLKRPPGLIRYDSLRGLTQGEHRFLRPRVYAYAVIAAGILVAGAFLAQSRPELPVTIVRQAGAPFVLDGDDVRNAYLLRTANKTEQEELLTIEVIPANPKAEVTIPAKTWPLPPQGIAAIPVFVEVDREHFAGAFDVTVKVTGKDGRQAELHAQFLGPDR
ncbi:MAG TPA: cytochrome c oxidase accessory protein CcoG [Myxococcales bacterium]|jgi:cytochrome c oxidase accessory protein FixG